MTASAAGRIIRISRPQPPSYFLADRDLAFEIIALRQQLTVLKRAPSGRDCNLPIAYFGFYCAEHGQPGPDRF
jgi:hypothetical protein